MGGPLTHIAGGRDESRIHGDQAAAGRDKSRIRGDQAAAGRDESRIHGGQAAAGRDESRIHGDQAAAGRDESRIHGGQAACEREVDLEFADIARVATTLALAPLSFVALTAPNPPRPTLDLAGREVGLSLRRHEGRCPFLLALTSERRLCGLGSLAPAACLAHPSTPLPAHVDRTPRASHQPELEARWRSRLAGRTRPLDPETALAGLLSLMAEAQVP